MSDYYSAWDYGGDVLCPKCQDNMANMADAPIWATDQCEVYEIICPHCGVVDTWAECIDNEDMDLWYQDLKDYLERT